MEKKVWIVVNNRKDSLSTIPQDEANDMSLSVFLTKEQAQSDCDQWNWIHGMSETAFSVKEAKLIFD